MERVRERIKAITAPRPRLLEPLQRLIEELDRVLRGWGAYFRVGNAGRQFATIDRYVHERLALFLSKKGGRAGRGWKDRYPWTYFQGLGIYRLVGTVAARKAAPTATR
jgi:hypothetical protein